MKTTTTTQTKAIADYLLQGGRITPIDALNDFGCFRLGARIYDLKKQGYDIETTTIKIGRKRVASYGLRVTE